MANLSENEQIIRQQQRLFDDVRPAGVRLFLLKHSGQTEKLAPVAEITSGWFVSVDRDFRDEINISIATLDNISDQVAQSSFIGYAIGVNSGDELDVFQFEKKDATRPNATSPSWKIHARRNPEVRFVIP